MLKGGCVERSKSFSLHTIALTREAKLWEDTRDCQGKRHVNVGYRIDRHQGRWEGRNFYRDFTELRWTDHEAVKIVIFEAETAMHHTTSALVQNPGIWRTWRFPAQWANYICSENSKSFSLGCMQLSWHGKLSYGRIPAPCPRHSAVNSGKGAKGTEKPKDNILIKNLKCYLFHYSETPTRHMYILGYSIQQSLNYQGV